MVVNIAVRHGELFDHHRQEIQSKVEKLLTYHDRITAITVTVDLAENHKHDKKVEVHVDAEHKHDFIAHAEDPDIIAALITAVEKLKQQLKHYKEKSQDHRRDPSHGGPEAIRP